MSLEDELPIFKQRVLYHTLPSNESKINFLKNLCGGNSAKIHELHDAFAPLINRRLEFTYVKDFLEQRGFVDIVRTIDHGELMIRAIKGTSEAVRPWLLPKKVGPYWFERYV